MEFEIVHIAPNRLIYWIIILLMTCSFLFALARSQRFRDELLSMIQDGDKVTHMNDGFRLITLFLACAFGIILGDLILKTVNDDINRWVFLGELFGFICVLLGISYKTKNN